MDGFSGILDADWVGDALGLWINWKIFFLWTQQINV